MIKMLSEQKVEQKGEALSGAKALTFGLYFN